VKHSFGQGILVCLLLVFFPLLALQHFLIVSRQETVIAREELTSRNMEDVLHRVRRNGRPEFLGKTFIDQAVYSIRRGESPAGSLERALNQGGMEWEFFAFAPGGEPQAIGAKKPPRIAAWRRLMAGLLDDRRGRRAPTPFEEKLAEQLLGDRTGINVLSSSRGNFRKLGNPVRYSYGGWWILRDPFGKILGHLLVLLKGDRSAETFFRRAVESARDRCRGLFSLAVFAPDPEILPPVTGPEIAEKARVERNVERIPREVVREILALGGIPGRFTTPRFFGILGEGMEERFLVAWHPRRVKEPLPGDGWSHIAWVVGFFSAAAVLRFFVMGRIETLSLRFIVPLLILGATIPALGYLGMSMFEQRNKIQAKEVYEQHRRIEGALRLIDAGFSRYLQNVADDLQRYVAAYVDSGNPAVLRKLLRSYGALILSGYAFDQTGKITKLLKAPKLNPTADRRLYSTMIARTVGIIRGQNPGGAADDSVFMYLLQTMGRLEETNILGQARLAFFDVRAPKGDSRRMAGLLLSFHRQTLVRNFLRRLVRIPHLRHGIDLALFRFDENSLTQALPKSFMNCADGRRLAERTMEKKRTLDELISSNHGRKMTATAVQGKNLAGYILVGTRFFDDIRVRDLALVRWTWAISAFFLALALLASGSLVRWVMNSLRVVQQGVAQIQAGDFHFALELEGNDEFAQLARGVENAAVTLEELYSSRPVQESLVSAEVLPDKRFELHYLYISGARPCGDYLDGFCLPENRFAVVIGDALGEGWQTTLVVAGIRMMVRLLLKRHHLPLDTVLNKVQEFFRTQRGPIRHMTLWIGILHFDSGEVQCVSAGHCPPVFQHRGHFELFPFGGTPLGVRRPVFDVERKMTLEGDARLILYTNAWFRMTKTSGEILGEEAFFAVIAGQNGKPAADVLPGIRRELEGRGFSGPADDDRSLLLLGCSDIPQGAAEG
jgi:serine phosphatase RsbU (regulator of sigma subunit)